MGACIELAGAADRAICQLEGNDVRGRKRLVVTDQGHVGGREEETSFLSRYLQVMRSIPYVGDRTQSQD